MQNKFILLIVFFIFISNELFSGSYPFIGKTYYVPYYLKIDISLSEFQYINLYQENNLEDWITDDVPRSSSGEYNIKIDNGFTILNVAFPEGSRDIVVFYSETQLILYDTFLKSFIYAQQINCDGYGLFTMNVTEASSYLEEEICGNTFSYTSENIDYNLAFPWVEGVQGDGIGESIIFSGLDASHLIIINGFFSPADLSLYYKNNRVKKILVRGFDNEGLLLFEVFRILQDTPNLQLVKLPEICHSVELEIVEVYSGSFYQATCISGVFKDGLLTDYDWGRR